jgi:septal ring factor EnvC (AmiA/AmiB activator)
VTARIDDLAHERDRLAAQVKELEATSAGLQKQLADTVQELKRVRRTLRP